MPFALLSTKLIDQNDNKYKKTHLKLQLERINKQTHAYQKEMSETFEITLDVNPQDKHSDISIRALCPQSKSQSEKIYQLQKGYLQLESDYFQEIFRNNPQIKEIQLNIDHSDILETILKCFYGFTCDINKRNIFEALKICDYLKIETLQSQIIDQISENVDDLDIIQVWILSQKLKLRNLEEACINRLKKEEYSIFIKPEAYQCNSNREISLNVSNEATNQNINQQSNQINNKQEININNQNEQNNYSNIVQLNTEQFKKMIMSQGNNFPFLKRKDVFNAIKFFCEKKFASNNDVANDKICKLTYDLINQQKCTSQEYQDIFCQQIFYDFNNKKNNSGSVGSINSEQFKQSYLLQQSNILSYSNAPNNSKGFFNPMQSLNHKFSGSNVLSPHVFTNSNYFFANSNYMINKTNQNGFMLNGNVSKFGDSLIFAQSFTGGKLLPEPIDELSESLNSAFNDLTSSYQEFLKKSSQSDMSQSQMLFCENQVGKLEEKMSKLLEDKQMSVGTLDQEIKKVDDYIIEQKKKNNMISMMNSNILEDMNNMLKSTKETQQQNQQNEEMNEIERQIQKKNTFQRLMSSGSSAHDLPQDMIASDCVPQILPRENLADNVFFINKRAYFNEETYEDKENDTQQNNQDENIIDEDNQAEYDEDDNSNMGDIDIDLLMEDIDEFSNSRNGLPFNKQTVLNTPHMNVEEIKQTFAFLNNIQPIQMTQNFMMNQYNTQQQVYIDDFQQ